MSIAFFDVAKREFERIKAKPLLLILMIVLPLIICFVLCETFKEGSPKNLPIGVLNADNSALSRQIVRMLDATPTCEVKYGVSSLEEGRKMIVGGQIYGLVVIPKNFQRDIYRGTYPKLVYYYNNQMLLIGGIITKDVNVAIQTVLAGINAKIQSKKGLPKDVAISQINIISVDEHVRSNPYLNYSYFLALGSFAHTFQVLIAFMSIWAVGIEFKEGSTKEWFMVSNKSVFAALFGKLLPYNLIFMSVITLTYLIYFIGYEAPFYGNIPFLAFATFVFVFAYQMIGSMFVSLTSNLRLSLSSGAFFTALGFTFAGMTYPVLAMPAFAQFYSGLLPLRPYLRVLLDQTFREIPVKYDLIFIFWMLALASLGILTMPLLKKHMQDEGQWYKL